MPKERITAAIKEILNFDYGFEIYIVMKSGNQHLKRFILDEGKPGEVNGFKVRLRKSIENAIRNKYLSEESQYADGTDLANEQNRFYVIEQSDIYKPFEFLDHLETQLESFRLADKDNADAILFRFIYQRGGSVKQLWAYQKIQTASIPNKKKKYFQVIARSKNNTDVFEEMSDQMFIITKKIDLIILGAEIVTDDINFMERHLRLETFIRASAEQAVTSITTVGLVSNVDKLQEYVQRSNKKYAKKMMQIHKFPVASMSKEGLIDKLYTVARWKNVFDIQQDQIYLKTYKDVENIIDLFTERYTKSEVTGQEYDTTVKNKAEPVETEILN